MSVLPDTLQQVDRTYVLFQERKLSYFSGCDYYRLASHPAVRHAIESTLRRFGLNVAASRLTSGNHSLYEELEERLATFFEAETAVVFSSGFAANLGVAQALAGDVSHALLDERAHTSLASAAQILACPILRFQHRNSEAAALAFRQIGPSAKPLLLTDGLFSHDGSVAPLEAYLGILPKTGRIWVDEAHAAGVLGKGGRGTPAHCGVSTNRIIRTMTLSKAFGVYGGAVLGSRALRQAVLAKSGLFVGNTPIPLPLVGGALRALEIVRHSDRRRTRLFRKVQYVKTRLAQAGLAIPDTPGPILAWMPRHANDATRIKRLLLNHDIYPPFVKYPGAPATGYFRFALSSEHRREQLDRLVEAMAVCCRTGRTVTDTRS